MSERYADADEGMQLAENVILSPLVLKTQTTPLS